MVNGLFFGVFILYNIYDSLTLCTRIFTQIHPHNSEHAIPNKYYKSVDVNQIKHEK